MTALLGSSEVGYSKYTEDIVDRWIEDTRDREDVFYRQWSVEHVPPPPPPPGEVYLEVGGRRLEDEEVFPVGRTFQFRANVSQASAKPEIIVKRTNAESIVESDSTGNYKIPVSCPESMELDAASGAYHRRHIIHFVEIEQIDRIPGLTAEISRFTSNPPGWTREQFEEFRVRVVELLSSNAVPQSFGCGLVEYFLAVQMEARENPAFSERLEAAFTILKRFAPFSDVAALITQYFRYRTNTLITRNSANSTQSRPLSWITGFLLQSKSGPSARATPIRAIELVVPEVEYCCMQAIRAMVQEDAPTALGMVNLSRKLSGTLIDHYRNDRLALVEARAHTEMGELSKARLLYQKLVNSPCPQFQAEATQFVNNGSAS